MTALNQNPHPGGASLRTRHHLPLFSCALLLLTILWFGGSGCTLVTNFEECQSDADCEFVCNAGICEGPPSCTQRSDCSGVSDEAYCLSGTCRVIDQQRCSSLGKVFTSNDAEDVIIPIGALMPLTTENAPKGEVTINGAELALRQINATSGSRAGAKYGLIACDTAYEPEKAAELARYLHEDLGVQGMIGPISSAESIEVADETRDDGIIIISPASTSPGLSGRSDYFWRTIASDADQARAMGTYLRNQGLDESVALLYTGDDDPYGAGFKNAITSYWSEVGFPAAQTVATFDKASPAANMEALNNSALYGSNGINPKTIILVGPIKSLDLMVALERDIISALPEDQKPTWVLPDALRDPSLLNRTELESVFPRIVGTLPSHQESTAFNNYAALYQQTFDSDPLRYQFPDKAYDAAYLLALIHESQEDPLAPAGEEMLADLRRIGSNQIEFQAIDAQFSSAADELNNNRPITLSGVSGPLLFTRQNDLANPTIISWEIDTTQSPAQFTRGNEIKETNP